MKNIKTYLIIALLGLGFIYAGCVKHDFDNPPSNCDDINDVKTHTIKELQEMWDGDTTLITGGVIIEGTVTSTDQFGTFYKEMVIQDESGAINIQINANDLFDFLPIGQKIFVRCDSLYIDKDGDSGAIMLGSLFNGDFGRIEEDVYLNYLIKTCDNNLIEPKILTIPDINTDDLLFQIVKFENVQFVNPDDVWNGSGSYEDHPIVDAAGNQLIIKTSGFILFGNDSIPSGSGSLTGFVSKYGGSYEIYVNEPNDADMTQPRF